MSSQSGGVAAVDRVRLRGDPCRRVRGEEGDQRRRVGGDADPADGVGADQLAERRLVLEQRLDRRGANPAATLSRGQRVEWPAWTYLHDEAPATGDRSAMVLPDGDLAKHVARVVFRQFGDQSGIRRNHQPLPLLGERSRGNGRELAGESARHVDFELALDFQSNQLVRAACHGERLDLPHAAVM